MQNDVWQYNGVDFRVGDTVKIVRLEEEEAPNGMGDGKVWQNAWAPAMDQTIGFTYEINDIDENGVHFVSDEDHDNWYAYPLSALENLSRQKEVVA